MESAPEVRTEKGAQAAYQAAVKSSMGWVASTGHPCWARMLALTATAPWGELMSMSSWQAYIWSWKSFTSRSSSLRLSAEMRA
jgi:hypothetical protein